MRQPGKVFQVGIILFGVTLLANTLPARAAPITIDGVSRFVGAWADDVLFGRAESSSVGFFDKAVSGSVVFEERHISGAAYQSSNITLLNDILTVDVAVGTSVETSDSSIPSLPRSVGASSWLGVAFTLHDWASYSATDDLLANTPTFFPDGVRLQQSFGPDIPPIMHILHFDWGSELNDRHSGLLAPGNYFYGVGSVLTPQLGDTSFDFFSRHATSLVITHVPEPSSLLLLVCGVGLLAASRWTSRTQQTI